MNRRVISFIVVLVMLISMFTVIENEVVAGETQNTWVMTSVETNYGGFLEEYKYKYDVNGNKIEEMIGDEWIKKYTYDAKNKLIYMETNNDFWLKYTYDMNGNEIYCESSEGLWV